MSIMYIWMYICLAIATNAFKHPVPTCITTEIEFQEGCLQNHKNMTDCQGAVRPHHCFGTSTPPIHGLHCWTSSSGKILPIPIRPTCNPPTDSHVAIPSKLILWKFNITINTHTGWLCKQITEHKTCTVYFFGAEQQSSWKSSDPVTASDCLEWQANKEFDWNVPHTAATHEKDEGYNCAWTGTRDTLMVTRIITQVSAIADPATKIYSGGFPHTGLCMTKDTSCPGDQGSIVVWEPLPYPEWPTECSLEISSLHSGFLENSGKSAKSFFTSTQSKVRFSFDSANLELETRCLVDGKQVKYLYKSLDHYLVSFLDLKNTTHIPFPVAKGYDGFDVEDLVSSMVVNRKLQAHWDQSVRVKRSLGSYQNPYKYVSVNDVETSLNKAELSWSSDYLANLTHQEQLIRAHDDCIASSQRWDLAWGMRFISPEVSIAIWTSGIAWTGRIVGTHMELWPCTPTPALTWCTPIVECSGYAPVTWNEDGHRKYGWIEGISGRVYRNASLLVCGEGSDNRTWTPFNDTAMVDLRSGEISVIKSHFYDNTLLDAERPIYTSAPMYDITEIGGTRTTLEAIQVLQQNLDSMRASSQLQYQLGKSPSKSSVQGFKVPPVSDWISSLFGGFFGPFIRLGLDLIVVLVLCTVIYLLLKKIVVSCTKDKEPRYTQGKPINASIPTWKV